MYTLCLGEHVMIVLLTLMCTMQTFGSQANALLRKSASYQQRIICTNVCLFSVPLLFCILLFIIRVC